MLKDAGFKVCAHMMPNLLGSTPELDRKALKEVFENSDYRPDELKIYPMMVTDKSELTQIWKKGGFQAYDDETLIALMADLLEMVPPYIRLNRVYRDIPAHQILHGSHLANLRQVAEELLASRGGKVIDTASREVKGKIFKVENIHLVVRDYEASKGHDYLITFEEK
jgi:elongator complex protein 3